MQFEREIATLWAGKMVLLILIFTKRTPLAINVEIAQ